MSDDVIQFIDTRLSDINADVREDLIALHYVAVQNAKERGRWEVLDNVQHSIPEDAPPPPPPEPPPPRIINPDAGTWKLWAVAAYIVVGIIILGILFG